MDTNNSQGQILIEVCLVISLIVVIGFAAITHLSELKQSPRKYQLTEDGTHASKNFYRYKK